MGFSWNRIHTSDIGILAEARTLPILPEAKLIFEEIQGADGFYDFSAFNTDGRAHYKPREWEYRCTFEASKKHNVAARVNAITRLFSSYSGYLMDDKCKNVRWRGIVMNKFSLTSVTSVLHTFGIIIQTQPFAEGLSKVNEVYPINDSGTIKHINTGTWYVKPCVFLTGAANNMTLGGIPVPFDSILSNQLIEGLELKPGDNIITVTGFTGSVRIEYTPLFIWGYDNVS